VLRYLQRPLIKLYPMKSKVEAGHKFDEFVHDVDVMKELHTDGAWGETINKSHPPNDN
jgi:hypothetical protein